MKFKLPVGWATAHLTRTNAQRGLLLEMPGRRLPGRASTGIRPRFSAGSKGLGVLWCTDTWKQGPLSPGPASMNAVNSGT